MRPVSTGGRVELQPRDFEIFELLCRYRYLRSTHIHRFVGGDRTKLIERLGKLFHEGRYLDRPDKQWDLPRARYLPAVYELTSRGRDILSAQPGREISEPLAASGGSQQFLHTLLVSEVLADIEWRAKSAGIRVVSWQTIRSRATEAATWPELPVTISHVFSAERAESVSMTLRPDAVFGLEYSAAGARAYRFFALEADRGTMPIRRKTLQGSSYLSKLLAYRAALAAGAFQKHWGVPNLFVLSALTSERRLAEILALVNGLSSGNGSTVLLFQSHAVVDREPRGTLWTRAGNDPLDIFGP